MKSTPRRRDTASVNDELDRLRALADACLAFAGPTPPSPGEPTTLEGWRALADEYLAARRS
jgi:hypothetical protein